MIVIKVVIMQDELVVGEDQAIISALTDMTNIVFVERTQSFEVSTDTKAIDAARAEMNARREKANDPRERDRILCAFQRDTYGRDTQLTLGTNIYGWAVHDVLKSNLCGGRAAITPRGFSRQQAIEYGCEMAKEEGTRFQFGRSHMPAKVLAYLDERTGITARRKVRIADVRQEGRVLGTTVHNTAKVIVLLDSGREVEAHNSMVTWADNGRWIGDDRDVSATPRKKATKKGPRSVASTSLVEQTIEGVMDEIDTSSLTDPRVYTRDVTIAFYEQIMGLLQNRIEALHADLHTESEG